MNISLIGARGSGKSGVSKRLATTLKRPVISTDLLIEYENDGVPIAQWLDRNNRNWHQFRDLEFKVVEKATRLTDVVIDCGGGVIVDLDPHGVEVFSDRKVSLLKSTGVVIWLNGDADRLAAKTSNSLTRPSLSDQVSAAEIIRRRLPFYERAADIVIDIEGKDKSAIRNEIVDALAQPRR